MGEPIAPTRAVATAELAAMRDVSKSESGKYFANCAKSRHVAMMADDVPRRCA